MRLTRTSCPKPFEPCELPSAFTTAPDATLVRNDALLESASVTGTSPQTVTYRINPRATWSDGVPVSGADFAYTWQAQSGRARYRDVDGRRYTPASTAGYRQISSVTSSAADPDQVVVRFAVPDPDWEALFDPILPAHVGRSVGFDHGFTDPVTSLVSAGPFLVQSYRRGSDVLLVRNPSWWGTAANLASIDVTFVSSAAQAALGLEQGQLGAAVAPFTAVTVASLLATPGLTVAVGAGPAFDDLVFDERSGPLSERAVRLALMIAVDRADVVAAARRAGDSGAAAVDDRVLAPSAQGYRDDAGILGQGGSAAPVTRARLLLAAAGFTLDRGVLTRHGAAVDLSMAVTSGSALAGDEAAAVVAAGRALGITVTVRGSSSAPAGPSTARAADMVLLTTSLASPSDLAATYGAGAAGNVSGYSSAVMQSLLARLVSAPTAALAGQFAGRVDSLAWDDAVDLPLLAVPTVLGYQTRYSGLTVAPTVVGVDDGDPAGWGVPQST